MAITEKNCDKCAGTGRVYRKYIESSETISCDKCGGTGALVTIGLPERTREVLFGDKNKSAFDHQEGGDHYKHYAIQPAEYVHKNKIPYLEGSVIYYVTRWREKNGTADLDKAMHTIKLIKELENGNPDSSQN